MARRIDIQAMRTYIRDNKPLHYKLEIKSYSSLSNTQAKKYESSAFEAGGRKWRLSLYPNEMIDEHRYISLYLATEISDGFFEPRHVYATFRLFVFDQNRKKYFTVEDGTGKLSRFDRVTKEVGFAKFLPRKTFKQGYLRDDGCTFGAEVFVTKNETETATSTESLILSTPASHIRSFRGDLPNFSPRFGLVLLFQNPIIVGGRKWQLRVYPTGCGQHENRSLSLYLRSADDLYTLPSVYVEFKLRVLNRRSNKGPHVERTGKHWFLSSANSYGWSDFMPLPTLKDRSKGFLKDDTLSVQVEMLVVSAS